MKLFSSAIFFSLCRCWNKQTTSHKKPFLQHSCHYKKVIHVFSISWRNSALSKKGTRCFLIKYSILWTSNVATSSYFENMNRKILFIHTFDIFVLLLIFDKKPVFTSTFNITVALWHCRIVCRYICVYPSLCEATSEGGCVLIRSDWAPAGQRWLAVECLPVLFASCPVSHPVNSNQPGHKSQA